MSYGIEEIEGIGPAYGAKLKAAGIVTTDDLLDRCAGAKGREETSEATGIEAGHLLTWANMADLMRLSGVGRQFGELLHAAGVDTVKELATRNADNLVAKLAEVNESRRIAGSTPALAQVSDWIEAAKATEARITH